MQWTVNIDSEEDFSSLKKVCVVKHRQSFCKQDNKRKKKSKPQDEVSRDNIDDDTKKPIFSDDSQIMQEMIKLPSREELWDSLDPHFCSHGGRDLCDKLYSNCEHGEKSVGEVLKIIDAIMKQYDNYMISAQAPEWQRALRTKTARRLIIKSVLHNHKKLCDFLEAILNGKNSDDHSDDKGDTFDYYLVYGRDYPVIFSGSLLEAGIEFDVPW